ncbi:hypothetical protein [Aurantibacter crassamenti]|nr:hypothetical protein [Aurantibacter crassamenti]
MKTKISNMLTFLLMVLVLGTQALLHGSWSIDKTKNVNNKVRS